MKFPVIVASAALMCKVFGAELRVDEKDLPRVPATEPAQAISTIQMRDGFRVELVASEPLIVSPVAVAFDENGRLFVAEMRDYSERRDERLGRIKLLEDTDGDGRFDKATIYATNLPWPTALICYDGGLFVGASPDILYFKDNNNDGVADVRKVVFTGFGNAAAKLNVQQLLNSLTWGLDNRIHGALGGNASIVTNLVHPEMKPLVLRGRDFSFDPRTFEMRAENGGGQWGLSFDDEGNKFICNNSRHIAVEMYDAHFALRQAFLAVPQPDVSIAADGDAAEVFRLSPDEPWRVIRTKWRVAGLAPGPVEGGGRASGYFTGAAGVMIYRGNAFPPEYRGDAFVADCGSNLIHRKKIHRDGLNFIAERAADEQKREFLASRDNWFRPVSMANAPDGTLYVVDMYRETVEHPWSLPPELKSKLDLNSGNDRGRIYRIVPDGFKQPKTVRLGDASTAELVKTLESPNGWHRDTAARLLVQKQDMASVEALSKLLHDSLSALARLHALHVLYSLESPRRWNRNPWRLGQLTADDVLQVLRDPDPVVRAAAPRFAAELPVLTGDVKAQLSAMTRDPDVRVRYQLLLHTHVLPSELRQMVRNDVENAWMRLAFLRCAEDSPSDLIVDLVADAKFLQRTGAMEFVRQVASIVGASKTAADVSRALATITRSPEALSLAEAFATGSRPKSLEATPYAAELAPVLAQARAVAADATAAEARRITAVRLLGCTKFSNSTSNFLLALLDPVTPPALQTAVTEALLSLDAARAIPPMLTHWNSLAPQTRRRLLPVLLSRRAEGAVLHALENGTIARQELTVMDVQKLLASQNSIQRARAEKLFHRSETARTEVVKKFRPALELQASAELGHTIYQARCASCHRAGGEGFAVGPDLASVANGGKEKLITSIFDPNAEVAAAYVAYSVDTKTGESFLGVLAGESPSAVMLKIPNGETVRVARENISSLRGSDKSLMPEGLEEGLSAQDVADLLEFVTQAKP